MAAKENAHWQAGAQEINCENATAGSLTQGGGSDPKLPPGTNYCLCAGCNQYFGGVRAFELHRVRFTCIDPVSIGLQLNAAGYWVRTFAGTAPVTAGKPVMADFPSERSGGTDSEATPKHPPIGKAGP